MTVILEHYFSKSNIPIDFLNQGMRIIYEKGNAITKLVISILDTVSDMERSQIRNRQLGDVRLAKARNVHKGCLQGTTENNYTFLSKQKKRKSLEYLKKWYKMNVAAKLAGRCSY
jgi:DNA invertase Pin-like site-specific DNA recombinase